MDNVFTLVFNENKHQHFFFIKITIYKPKKKCSRSMNNINPIQSTYNS